MANTMQQVKFWYTAESFQDQVYCPFLVFVSDRSVWLSTFLTLSLCVCTYWYLNWTGVNRSQLFWQLLIFFYYKHWAFTEKSSYLIISESKQDKQNKKTLVLLDTDTDNFKFHILSSKMYDITFDDVLVFHRGIVSASVSRYFRQVSYQSQNFVLWQHYIRPYTIIILSICLCIHTACVLLWACAMCTLCHPYNLL